MLRSGSEYKQTEQKMQMQQKVNRVVNSNKGEMRTALVMLLSLMTGEGRGENEGSTWLDYAMSNMLVVKVVGALSVAMGMWKFLQWFMKEKSHDDHDGERQQRLPDRRAR